MALSRLPNTKVVACERNNTMRPIRQISEVVRVTDRNELITVQAAADRLAVSRWMIYRLIWEQQVKSVQIGRCRRIIRQSLDDYLANLIDGVA